MDVSAVIDDAGVPGWIVSIYAVLMVYGIVASACVIVHALGWIP
jgi:hypothetical protein